MVPFSSAKTGEEVIYIGPYTPHKGKTFVIIDKSRGKIFVSLPDKESCFEFSPNELEYK